MAQARSRSRSRDRGGDAFDAGAAAEAFLKAWSDNDEDRPAISDEDCLPTIPKDIDAVFAIHSAMISSPSAVRLGGLGGLKLGWKGNPMLAAQGLPAMYSPIFDGSFVSSGAEVSVSRRKLFCVEAEYGFVLSEGFDPQPRPYTAEEVWARVSHIELCIELCGTRLGPNISPYHLLSDAMSHAGVVRGARLTKDTTKISELQDVQVSISKGGSRLSTGTGKENPVDSPLSSLTFVINDLTHRRQLKVEAGSLVIAGHCCQLGLDGRPGPSLQPGNLQRGIAATTALSSRDEIVAEFDGLGSVSVTLTA